MAAENGGLRSLRRVGKDSGTVSTMPLAPTVGVVVANYDNGAFVARAIDSVARQTFRDIRVIVVDDASNDESDVVIREHLARLADPRFHYVRLPANAGQAGSMRCGLAELNTQ